MAYWNTSGKDLRPLDSFGLATNQTAGGGGTGEFYELELGVVLDIVIDPNHPIFSKGSISNIDVEHWPEDLQGQKAKQTDKDLSWIGRALVRPIVSEKTTSKEQLSWARPLESNISEYPLVNETVILVKYNRTLFYTKKVNFNNWLNNNLDFSLESSSTGKENTELYKTPSTPYEGPISTTKYRGGSGYEGVAGRYFVANNKIRNVGRFEGDLLIESRFGQTIHFTAYNYNRGQDSGLYADYKNGGNPMILIRNRQRPLLKVGQKLELHNSPNKATIEGTEEEKNVGGYINEDINHDGSTIQITCGQTISDWVTTCYKKMFGNGEEVAAFNGTTNFKYPELSGDQVIINSDRLIFSSRYGEIFNYSKKRYAVVTDSEYTVDAHDQIVMTTHVKTVFNSPAIYLGEYDQTGEPALLGQTTVNWLYELCNWLLEHTHWYMHAHVDCGGLPSPFKTQMPVEILQLTILRDNLHALLSRRVFLTGGGFAPGQNGAKLGG